MFPDTDVVVRDLFVSGVISARQMKARWVRIRITDIAAKNDLGYFDRAWELMDEFLKELKDDQDKHENHSQGNPGEVSQPS
jgi:hypothetical protein